MIIYHCDRCLPFIPLPGITQPHDEAAEIGEFLDLDVALGEAERTSFFLACGNLGKTKEESVTNLTLRSVT
jgi:hypothetical protein